MVSEMNGVAAVHPMAWFVGEDMVRANPQVQPCVFERLAQVLVNAAEQQRDVTLRQGGVKVLDKLQTGRIRVAGLAHREDDYLDIAACPIFNGGEMLGQFRLDAKEQVSFKGVTELVASRYIAQRPFPKPRVHSRLAFDKTYLHRAWHVQDKGQKDANDNAKLHRDHQCGQSRGDDHAGVKPGRAR